MNNRREIPSIGQLFRNPGFKRLENEFGHQAVLTILRGVLEKVRANSNLDHLQLSVENLVVSVEKNLQSLNSPTLIPVINATGVILHTNLGRAPLSKFAIRELEATTPGYTTLEYDLEKGVRGSRTDHCRDLLVRLTGAEDALVVNNNAAAVLLCLTALAKQKQVAIARSQLIEIGGEFRIPDVMKLSGAKLVEVGTTNKVRLSDYEEAIFMGAKIIMVAHPSNFKVVGFTEEPDIKELIQITQKAGGILIYDLGSGALLDTSKFGILKEPMVQEVVQAGADLVCFSGDKLLGGPQAGIIIGQQPLISKLKKHPLARAVRVDKLCLASLHTTLVSYLKGQAELEIPTWQMISMPLDEIKQRAISWQSELGVGEVIEGKSTIGGGSLPGETIPTYLFSLDVDRPNTLLRLLREETPPVIARIQDDKVVFDPRTVLKNEDAKFIESVKLAHHRRKS